jgi:ABC-type multidrug transport system fused ATPase/permease subunit
MLRAVIRTHRLRLASAYGLTIAAHLTGQLYPLVTAFAINGVLAQDLRPVLALGVWHLLMMGLEVTAKMYDTRVFTRVYADLAGGFVERAHAGGTEPSVVAARAILTREYVDFLEKDVPGGLTALVGLATALIVLTSLDPVVGGACLVLIAPLILINVALGRRAVTLNRGLNDRLEREVGLLSRGRTSTVRRHFQALGAWRVRLSDSEARAFGLMEVCVIVLIGAALWRLGQGDAGGIRAGDVYAVFSYVWRFVLALDQVPVTVQQIAKLKDLNGRMRLSGQT